MSRAFRLAITFMWVVSLCLPTLVRSSATPSLSPTSPTDAWWDNAYPYRLPVTVSGQGLATVSLDFGAHLDALGLNHALLDVRSIRVIPYASGAAGNPLAYVETYSTLLDDADTPQIGWSDTGVYWTVNDGTAQADPSRHTQGTGSLKAIVDNLPGGYGYPGVELHIASGDPLTNWSPYETFLYDVWPEVNASAVDQAPDLYWYKLYNACGGTAVTQGGPPLALNQWNPASVSLNPFDACWPADGLNLSDITRMEFHTRDNDTVNGNSGLWDDGDQLTLWFDNLRLVDQNNGTLQWQTVPGVTLYYIYFDILAHAGHPLPEVVATLSGTPVAGVAGAAESGGYFHLAGGATLPGGWSVWAAPTVEKITPTMLPPIATAPVTFAAARGEFEAFQLVVRAPAETTAPVTASAFIGPVTIPAPTLHQVGYVPITTAGDAFDRFGAWPDPLWPITNGTSLTFPTGQNQPLWFTVQVPWDAPAGDYMGTVIVGGASIPVTLTVWDFTLPRETHLASEWGFDWSNVVEMYKGTDGGVQACYWDVVDSLKQQFADARLTPKGVAWPAGLNYPGGMEYDCNGTLRPDAWGDWDFATLGGKYIHGEQGFNEGYGFEEFLAFGPTSNWPPDSLPYSFCGVGRSGVLGDAQYQAEWTQYLSALDAYLVSDAYTNAYYHIVNEPQTDADYTIVGQLSALTEAAAPHLRQMVSEQVEPAIYNYPGAKIDLWMPTISNYESEKSHVRQANYGEDVWWYYLYGDDPPLPNPILMSHPGAEARLTPWLAWHERVDGLLHYSTTDWSSNPWTTPNVTGQDNGDGFFFYPPHQDGSGLNTCGENGHQLVPSIRWMNLRDGMEDFEYLWLLAGGDPQVGQGNAADAFVAELIQSRTLFSHIPTDLAATRAALAAAIQGIPAEATALKTANPASLLPGGQTTFTLAYYHVGEPTTLTVVDPVPDALTILNATGPGTVEVNGQTVTWTVDVQEGEWVTLAISTQADLTPGAVTNTATFSSDQILTAQTTVLVYQSQVFLPILARP
ncbi:MAG: DUF4091 domain-containing protein [Anaerolineales bacterium]|nr:DUF4091 domain-containing protein [Anaerolineales bacterium]